MLSKLLLLIASQACRHLHASCQNLSLIGRSRLQVHVTDQVTSQQITCKQAHCMQGNYVVQCNNCVHVNSNVHLTGVSNKGASACPRCIIYSSCMHLPAICYMTSKHFYNVHATQLLLLLLPLSIFSNMSARAWPST